MEQFESSTAVEREKRSNLIHLRRWNEKNGAIWFIYGGGTGKTERFDSSAVRKSPHRSALCLGSGTAGDAEADAENAVCQTFPFCLFGHGHSKREQHLDCRSSRKGA